MIRLYEAKITDFTQADYTKQYSLLECAIRKKIDAKQQAKSKLQSLAGYILLYKAVNELYPKKQIKITHNEYGKPLCDFCFFSISHCEERVVCAVSDVPIGADIQKISCIKPRTQYKFFNSRENDYVNQDALLSAERYIEVFTKKEAAVKMLGLSLATAIEIDTFSTRFDFKIQKTDDFILCICKEK